jgi:hypothetical protein
MPWTTSIRRSDPPGRSSRRGTAVLVSVGLVVALVATAAMRGGGAVAGGSAATRGAGPCEETVTTKVPQPTAAHLEAAGLAKLPVAPDARRVDLVAPPFSDSTSVTNPLFPISTLHSVILNGRVGGESFRVETTLLPDTRVIEWSPGQCVKTLVSQYVAYLDGRIEEVALDFYAQAEDGSVWYFGEDVYNYLDGAIADTSGTWLAGKEGPAAMIMPADPTVGQVNRPENIPGLVFEEVAVKETGMTVAGPRGRVRGAIVGQELHDDGTFSDKVFAPGYGEFFTAHEGDVEALALAVPTDTRRAPVPAELRTLLRGAYGVVAAAGAKRWKAASATVARMTAAWKLHRAAGGVPPRLVGATGRALGLLARTVKAQQSVKARDAALDVALAALDLQLQYRRPAAIDRARFDLWARQVVVDVAARDPSAVSGDVATLEWVRDRIARTLNSVDVTRIDTLLEELRVNAGDEDLPAAADTARALRRALARARPAS